MNNSDNHMDELFRSRLEGYAPEPPAQVWDNIRSAATSRRRPGRMLYLRIAAAAAAVVLLFLGGRYLLTPPAALRPVAEQPAPVAVPETRSAEAFRPAVIAPENQPVITPAAPVVTLRQSGQKAPLTSPDIRSSAVSAEKSSRLRLAPLKNIDARLETASSAVGLQQKQTQGIPVGQFTATERALIAANIATEVRSKKEETAWKLGLRLAPGYSSHVASHSSQYARNMTYSNDDPQTGVDAGIAVQFKTSKRWSVESGVYYAQSGEKSGNSLRYLSSPNADYAFDRQSSTKYLNTVVNLSSGKVAMNSTAGVIRFSKTPPQTEFAALPELSSGAVSAMLTEGEFAQLFDFVEIPLLLRYRLVDSRFGVDMVGGVSAGIVVGNNVYMEGQFGREYVGKTEDISPLNLSGTVGVGMVYALGKHFSLSVEPRLNYYLNSINTDADIVYRPLRAGIYTGLTYEF